MLNVFENFLFSASLPSLLSWLLPVLHPSMPQLQLMLQLQPMAQLQFMLMSPQHMTMDMPSMMDTVELTLLPMRTAMDTPPMENTVLHFPMVEPRLSPMVFLMLSLDMLLMSNTRELPFHMLPQPQLMPQPLLFQLIDQLLLSLPMA